MSQPVTPLFVRSGYSLQRGAAPLGALVDRAAAMGHAHLALTDVNNLYGVTTFWSAASEAGLAPIVGAQLSDAGADVIALVASEQGFENLCRLISRIRAADDGTSVAAAPEEGPAKSPTAARKDVPAGPPDPNHCACHRPSPSPREGMPLVFPRAGQPALRSAGAEQAGAGQAGAGRADGGTASEAAGGAAPFRMIANRPRPPRRPGQLIDDLCELSAGLEMIVDDPQLAAALCKAHLPRESLWLGIDPAVQSVSRLAALEQAGRELSMGLVAAASAMMLETGDLELARLLAAIRTGSTFEAVSPTQLPHPKALLRGPAQLADELADWPAATDNNARLASRCAAFKLLPRRPVFPGFALPEGVSAPQRIRQLCREGMLRRYGRQTPEAAARVQRELSLIVGKGFCEYFLVVHDIVRYARRRGVPVAGRGSGASSLVAYLLGITNVCPLRYDIPFERFLNERREDFPDLDVDFCWRIRDEVIEYVFNRWGADHVAMVCTHNCFQERSALREAAKAMGYSNAQISAGEVGDDAGDDADNPGAAGAGIADAEVADLARMAGSAGRGGKLAQLARRLVGLPNHLSVHPGGIVLGPRPIDHYVPVEPAPKGVMIAQLDKDGIEQMGLVKLDLLGNRNLSTVRYACELIGRRGGPAIDIEALDDADPATVAALRAADTVGCNQLESPAMRHLLACMAPAGVGDVMKALALIRPGAASIGMKETFIRRQRGLDSPPPQPEPIRRILGHSHGVMLYEDDVMLVAAAMTGLSMDRADRFRKAVQNCRDDAQRLALSREFLGACRANGFDEQYAKGLWIQMAKFNAYSFCRAHAGSYAMLAYAGAYLKTHRPMEFWTAAINNNQSMYPLRVYVEQAKRAGVRFALPDINRSEAEFTIDADADGEVIRVGLGRIGGVGPSAVEAILHAREDRPFDGLGDLLTRTGLLRDQARALVLCGALDSLGRRRPVLMMELNLYFTIPSSARPVAGRTLLSAAPVIPDPPGDYPPSRKAADQWRLLGLSVSEHILSCYRPALEGHTDARSGDLPARVGRPVRLAGMIEALRVTHTGRGEAMMFLTLDDEDGLFEVTVFPDACRALRGRMDGYGPYIVTGTVEDQYGSLAVSARDVKPLGATVPAVHLAEVG